MYPIFIELTETTGLKQIINVAHIVKMLPGKDDTKITLSTDMTLYVKESAVDIRSAIQSEVFDFIHNEANIRQKYPQ